MAEFSTASWVVMGIVAAAAVLGILHMVASTVRDEHKLREIKAEAERLRSAWLRGRADHADVIDVDEAPPRGPASAAASPPPPAEALRKAA